VTQAASATASSMEIDGDATRVPANSAAARAPTRTMRPELEFGPQVLPLLSRAVLAVACVRLLQQHVRLLAPLPRIRQRLRSTTCLDFSPLLLRRCRPHHTSNADSIVAPIPLARAPHVPTLRPLPSIPPRHRQGNSAPEHEVQLHCRLRRTDRTITQIRSTDRSCQSYE
jgi:hypothetical protein